MRRAFTLQLYERIVDDADDPMWKVPLPACPECGCGPLVLVHWEGTEMVTLCDNVTSAFKGFQCGAETRLRLQDDGTTRLLSTQDVL